MEKYIEIKDRENELLEKIKKLERMNRELAKLPERAKQDKKNKLKEEYDEVIQAIPAGEWNQKATSLWEKGKYKDPDKAIEDFKRVISLSRNLLIPSLTVPWLTKTSGNIRTALMKERSVSTRPYIGCSSKVTL